MKVGNTTKLENVTITSTVNKVSGFDKENIIDANSLKKWKVQNGAVTLTLEFDAITADAICLFNCNIKTAVEIKTYSAVPALIESKSIAVADLTGFDSLNALFELTDTTTNIVKIELVFTAADTSFFTSVGFIWVGNLIDFGCLEALQVFGDSENQVTVSRANTVSRKERYNFQEFNLTTKKEEDFTDLQTNFRLILDSGYGLRRPFLFSEKPYTESSPNLIYGILNSPRIGYDTIESSDSGETFNQATIRSREVF